MNFLKLQLFRNPDCCTRYILNCCDQSEFSYASDAFQLYKELVLSEKTIFKCQPSKLKI